MFPSQKKKSFPASLGSLLRNLEVLKRLELGLEGEPGSRSRRTNSAATLVFHIDFGWFEQLYILSLRQVEIVSRDGCRLTREL
jgi:hypothetical protein